MRIRGLLTALALTSVVTLAACSAGSSSGPAGASGDPSTPTATPATTTDTASTGSAGAAPAGRRCDEATFVPRTSAVLRSSRPTVIYAAHYDLEPDVRATARAYPLGRATRVEPRVRLAGGGTAPPAVERQVLRTFGTRLAVAGLPDRYDVPLALENTGAELRSFLVYAGADVRSGTWTSRSCDRRTATVTRLHGTFTTVGRLRRGAQGCGQPPSQDTPLGRVAARRACA